MDNYCYTIVYIVHGVIIAYHKHLLYSVHGVIIANHDPEYLHQHINETLAMLGIKANSEDITDIVDGHMGGGYAINTKEDLGKCF